jgi:Uma2 family endonuclease
LIRQRERRRHCSFREHDPSFHPERAQCNERSSSLASPQLDDVAPGLHNRRSVAKGDGDTIEFVEKQGTLTYDDLVEMFPVDNVRRELFDGELVVSASPLTRHQVVSMRLSATFFNHLADRGGAQVFHAPLDVVLSDKNVVQPDLLVVLDRQSQIITEKNIQGVPALLVEILSEPRMDRVRKRDLYARFKVTEYWVVDPDADRVEVYRLRGEQYAKPEILETGDILEFGPLPGLSIDVGALLAR